MMIVNDELDELSQPSRANAKSGRDLVGNIVAFFRLRYVFWSRDPDLARSAMREMNAPYVKSEDLGLELVRGQQRRAQIVDNVAKLVLSQYPAIDAEEASAIAWMFTDIYLSEVRMWLNDEHPTVEAGIRRLRRLLTLAARGLP